jgi:hypothetical protein
MSSFVVEFYKLATLTEHLILKRDISLSDDACS